MTLGDGSSNGIDPKRFLNTPSIANKADELRLSLGVPPDAFVLGYVGRITRDKGIQYVKEHDHKLDQKMLDDWLAFTRYTDKEFWDIVEKFWNRKIFEKVDGIWKLKNPIWEQETNNSKFKN